MPFLNYEKYAFGVSSAIWVELLFRTYLSLTVIMAEAFFNDFRLWLHIFLFFFFLFRCLIPMIFSVSLSSRRRCVFFSELLAFQFIRISFPSPLGFMKTAGYTGNYSLWSTPVIPFAEGLQ